MTTQRQKQGVSRWLWSLGLLLGFMVASVPAAQATVRYATPGGVGTCASWVDACTLQAALSVAGSGDEIWVQQGTHKPTTGTDRTATFQLKAGVALYGGFAGGETTRAERDWETNVTTLSGDIGVANDTADNSYQVVTGATGATLDGFTISGGNANGDFPMNEGGGMFNDNGSSPTLTNVTFSGNSARTAGGGMANEGNSSPTLTNVTFSGNSANFGGGMFNDGASPTLTNVTFSGNSARSQGGGMHNHNGGSPTLINVTFSGNSASSGGGMANDFDDFGSNPTLTNVTFSGNFASFNGGGMDNFASSPTLTNVTFSGNSAANAGGGMAHFASSAQIRNSILWGNTAPTSPQISHDPGASSAAPSIRYSIVQGGLPQGATDGGNNKTGPNDDPKFVTPIDLTTTPAPTTAGNLRLRAGSAALDAGDKTLLPADTTDLDGDGITTTEPLPFDRDGNPRVVGTNVDMGAYEVQPNTACPETFDIGFGGAAYATCFRDVLRPTEITSGVDLGMAQHPSLNITGSAGAAARIWLTVYDDTPDTPEPGWTYGAQTVCADVLIERVNNSKGAGVVTLFNEGVGKQGLALLVYDAGNTDSLALTTVDGNPANNGKLTTLRTLSLKSKIATKAWYRLVLTVTPGAVPPAATASIRPHAVASDPTSPLGTVLGSFTYAPAALPAGVSSLGQAGLIATAVSAVVNSSITNFSNDPARCAR